MKTGTRVIGVNESPENQEGNRLVAFTDYRGSDRLERLSLELLEKEADQNEFLTGFLNHWMDHSNTGAVITGGLCLGGARILDIFSISEKLDIPVITVTGVQPDQEQFIEAIRKSEYDEKIFSKYGEPVKFENDIGTVYSHFAGVSKKKVEEILEVSSSGSAMPEALRVAKKIASGISEEVVSSAGA